jgi:hypothetical protein
MLFADIAKASQLEGIEECEIIKVARGPGEVPLSEFVLRTCAREGWHYKSSHIGDWTQIITGLAPFPYLFQIWQRG